MLTSLRNLALTHLEKNPPGIMAGKWM